MAETATPTPFGVHSEVGQLRKVMVCAPGRAHQRLTPSNCDELLFDDVLWVDNAKRDHFDFVNKMRDRGIDVVEMHNLLTQTVAIPEAKAWILDNQIIPNQVGLGLVDEIRSYLEGLPHRELAETLIGGLSTEEFPDIHGGEMLKLVREAAGVTEYLLRFATDWNRSFELMPQGTPVGAAVFLHGLTDSPYSLRHLAELYRDRGFVAIGIRLPGHGTVPGGLTAVAWRDWMAAVRLAMREARLKAGSDAPIHIVGYSNGGALALLYALDAQEDESLTRPARIVLMSPMIGVTRFARFSGLAGLPALLPAFAKTAWLDLLPEFNPFKYNSFPVNAARQSYALTMAVQDRITRLAQGGKLGGLAPVLTFQSVLDATVSVQAVVNALYGNLPDNGSELVLFDINRHTELGLLFRTRAEELLPSLVTPAPRNYRLTVLGNRDPTTDDVVARSTPAGSTNETVQPLGLTYAPDIYSLSHVAVPFPPEDGLYGNHPDPADDFGIHLGTIAAHGERSALIVSLDWLLRMSWNPFFPFVRERVLAGLPGAEAAASVVPFALPPAPSPVTAPPAQQAPASQVPAPNAPALEGLAAPEPATP